MPLQAADGSPLTAALHQAQPDEAIKVETAFLVFKLADGSTVMHHDLGVKLDVARPPSRDEVKGMCANVIQDTNNSEIAMLTTQQVLGNLMQLQQQAMNQAQGQHIMEKLKTNGRSR